MLKKKFIFEDDNDVDEMPDYKKLMRLVKKRLNPSQVEFYNSEGEDFSDNIEITYDGLMFTFDGLQEYLSFFFPDDYSQEENSEGYYDAKYYESMYDRQWNWYQEFSDRDSQDWEEGHITDRFQKDHLDLVRDIAKMASPNLYSKISKMLDEGKPLDSDLNFDVRSFLEALALEDSIVDLYTNSNVEAVEDSTSEGIAKVYCDSLSKLGIERYSQKYCFWKYQMDWESCLILFASFGSEDDKLLDLLFNTIRRSTQKHLPSHYEMEQEFWDNEKFEESWIPGLTKILEKKLEEIEENPENYGKNYFDAIDKVMSLGGTDVWINTEDGKYQIKIRGIEPKTSLITYQIVRKGDYRAKGGKTDIDGILNMIYNEKIFDLLEYVNKFSILRNKTFF